MSHEQNGHAASEFDQRVLPSKTALTLAKIARRAPWLLMPARITFSFLQPRFTCGVVGIVANAQGAILIVEHVFHPWNSWGLPGGWLAAQEDPEVGLRRELQEELGLNVDIHAPILVRAGFWKRDHLDIAFACSPQNEVSHLSTEILGYSWVQPAQLPQLSSFHAEAIQAFLTKRQHSAIQSGSTSA